MPGIIKVGMVRQFNPLGEEPPFSPTDLSGLLGWWKADSLALSDTDPVTTWADSSGNGNNAGGANGVLYRTNQINGLPAVFFDGSDDSLDVSTLTATTKPVSIFAVVKPADTSTRTVVSCDAAGGLQLRIDPKLTANKATVAAIGSSNTSLSGGTAYRVALTYSATGAYTFYLNGTADGSGTNDQTFSASIVRIGRNINSEPMSGLIAELLIYDSVLSSTDRASVESYLSTKYSI